MEAKKETAARSYQSGSSSVFSSGEPARQIRFISLVAEASADDFDIIKDIIKTRGFSIDFIEFKLTNTKVQRRLIQPTQKDGPRERIEIEEKLDVNSGFKYLRQLSSKVQNDVNNVLLVQMNQIKGFPCSLPLIFPELLKAQHGVLVHGLTDIIQSQLVSKADLAFASIDDPISKNPYIRSKILQRAEREKSMQAIARELKDFKGLPETIQDKLGQMVSGNKVPLSDEEVINIILISDLFTRYLPLFQSFERDIVNRNLPVAALASQFSDFTKGIPTEKLIETFRDYFIDDDRDSEVFSCETNAQFFSFFYKQSQILEEKRVKIGDHPLTRADMFATLRSLITLMRTQIDPEIWCQCRFFYKHDDLQTLKKENIKTIDKLLDEVYARLKIYHAASSLSLLEIHLIHNIHRFISGRKVSIAQSNLSEIDMGVIKSGVIPILYQPDHPKPQAKPIRLILGTEAHLERLINPVHTVGRVYGFMMGRRLRENVQRFLKPGLRDLLSRFGRNFFNIFYEMAVQESDLPISRNEFAKWLKLKSYFKKPEEFGYQPNQLETLYDPCLTATVLMENGDSCFHNTYSENDFSEEFESARKAFSDLIMNMKKDGRGLAKVISDFVASGNYNLKSQAFKDTIKKHTIYKTLISLFNQSCIDSRFKIKELAVGGKLVIKIPLEFEPLLLVENIFQLKVEEETIQIHLIAVAVESEEDLEPLSRSFSRNMILSLKKEAAAIKELFRGNRILRVYQSAYLDYMKALLIAILDRQINNTILKIRQQKNQTPNHIRYHFENYEKLFIGTSKNANLGKLIHFGNGKQSKEVVYTLNLNQIVQAIVLHKSASHKLREYRSTIDQIRSLLERISSKVEDYESLTYLKQISKFQEMISTPVEELNEHVLNLAKILAGKIQKTVQQSKTKKGALAWLYQHWQKQYPSQPKKIDFYLPFLREDERDPDQKLFLEIQRARDILLNIKRRKCVVFFPELHQKESFDVIVEVAHFIVEREFDTHLYVEISGLNKEQIEILSRVVYPGNFFRLDRIKPIKPQVKT